MTPLNFFEQLSLLGITLHPGGSAATKKLFELLKIENARTVLDVGCGSGRTLSRLAKDASRMVIGIDLMPTLAAKTRRRLQNEHSQAKASTLAADALHLPFADETFDAVFTESVAIFLPKQEAVAEFVRVCKPGGRIGMIELTWVKSPPDWLVPRIEALMLCRWQPLTQEEWLRVMRAAGLQDVKSHLQTHGWSGLLGDGLSEVWDELRMLVHGFLIAPIRRRWYNRQVAEAFLTMLRHTACGIYVGVKGEA